MLAFIFLSFAGFILIALLRLALGTVNIPLHELFRVVTGAAGHDSSSALIITTIRLPRFLMAFLTGSILALSGLVMQNILRNPLAEPFTLGVSSGASFGAVIAIYAGTLLNSALITGLLPVFSLLGGLGAALIVFAISARTSKFSTISLIISGIVVNAFFSSGITFLLHLLSNKANLALSWMMGYIRIPDRIVWLIAAIEVPLLLYAFLRHKELDILFLSEKNALVLGVDGAVLKKRLFLVASAATSLIVSQTGIIGFVGVIVPHFVRNRFDVRFKYASFAAVWWGGLFLAACDIVSSYLPSLAGLSGEIPIGVITSLAGAPFFILLLLGKERYIS